METLIKFGADGLLFVIAGASAIAFLMAQRWRKWPIVLPTVVMAGLTSLLVGKVLSLLYQPSVERPFITLGQQAGAAYINNPGFPSDHMLLGTVIVLIVWFMTPYRKVAILLTVLLLLMGAARVLALVHTPLDIVGGLLAGLSGGIWYLKHRIAAR